MTLAICMKPKPQRHNRRNVRRKYNTFMGLGLFVSGININTNKTRSSTSISCDMNIDCLYHRVLSVSRARWKSKFEIVTNFPVLLLYQIHKIRGNVAQNALHRYVGHSVVANSHKGFCKTRCKTWLITWWRKAITTQYRYSCTCTAVAVLQRTKKKEDETCRKYPTYRM